MIKEVMVCIKLGCDLTAINDFEEKLYGASALHVAAYFGQSTTFNLLLETKSWPNANIYDADRQTPLHLACKTGQLQMIRALI